MPDQVKKKTTDPRIRELASEVAGPREAALIEDIIANAVRMGTDKISLADLKLFRRAFSEMRYASKVFGNYTDHRKVAVFGSARTKPEAEEFKLATEFSAKMVEKGYMIITGGGDGIMGAAQHGAGAANSFGLNINLPFEQRANETIHGDPKLINFNYFFTRKLSFMKETHAFVLLPGGFGTQDEGFECLTLMQTGKTQVVPIILLDKINGHYWETWRRFLDNDLLSAGLISKSDFHLIRIVHTAGEAVDEIVNFYKLFHSYRWVRERMVIRIHKPLAEAALARLNETFAQLLIDGKIEQCGPLPEEKDDVGLKNLRRIVLTPHKHDFGMIRLLIDSINSSETA